MVAVTGFHGTGGDLLLWEEYNRLGEKRAIFLLEEPRGTGVEVVVVPDFLLGVMEEMKCSSGLEIVQVDIAAGMMRSLLRAVGQLHEGMTLLWNLPETGFHPAAIPILSKVLVLLMDRGVRVVFRTNCYDLMQYVEDQLIERELPSDISVFVSLLRQEGDGRPIGYDPEAPVTMFFAHAMDSISVHLYSPKNGRSR